MPCAQTADTNTTILPIGAFTALTGVSGSGKSTLANDVILAAVEFLNKNNKDNPPDVFASVESTCPVGEAVYVSQSEIGKTSRGNPASYCGVFTDIRYLFANTQQAHERGYTAGTFSFNSGTGRCPTCQGAGFERVEMQFLSDVLLRCPDCNGTRYRAETLEVKLNYLGRGEASIADVLEMTVCQAYDYFLGERAIERALQSLIDVGLDYVKLGHPLSTLSGGEAQRIKLAQELARRDTGRTLYILDEPTTGLHFEDVAVLMRVLRRLTALGNTVIVIEHNTDVIAGADWVVDIGPEGGNAGGQLVFEGTPEDLMKCSESITGQWLHATADGKAPKKRR